VSVRPRGAHRAPGALRTPLSKPRTRRARMRAVAGAGALLTVMTVPLAAGASAFAAEPQPASASAAEPVGVTRAAERQAGASSGASLDESAFGQKIADSAARKAAAAAAADAAQQAQVAADQAAAQQAADAAAQAAAQIAAQQAAAQAAAAQAAADQARAAAAEAASRSAVRASGWVSPVAGGYQLTAGFGDGGSHWSSGHHTGQDFAVPIGTPVHAVGDGTVISAGLAGPYGNRIQVRHGDGTVTTYNHLSRIVVAGGPVSAGQVIGLSGNTGNTTGPHLHFEVLIGGAFTNPLTWLRNHGVGV
jgi:murein DD-endopeptidase MepM/ murein hydrolase activator NlpD